MTIDPSLLSPEQRRELYDQLAYEFRGVTGKGVRGDIPTELWDVIGDALQGAHRQPVRRFVEDYGKARYLACAEQLEALIVLAVPSGTRKPVVMAVRRCMIDCLITHLRRRNIPVTPAVIMNSFVMLRHAIEQAYPGYIDAQLLHRVAELTAA